MKHAVLGASSAKRWMACPGSIKLGQGMPNHESEAAKEGTAAHEMAEIILSGDENFRIEDLFCMKAENGVKFTEEMAEAVEVYTNYIDELLDINTKPKLSIETSFNLDSIRKDMFGTNDASIYDPENKHLHVLDYKHGAGIMVEVEDNPQLKYYALGAMLNMDLPVEKITITIVQPRKPHTDGPIRSQELTPEDLMDFAIDLHDAALETEKDNAKLKSGDHCRFCPAAPNCTEIENLNTEIMKTDFESLLTVGAYNPEDLSAMLDKLAVMEGFVKRIREFAYAQAENGVKTPHYKLVAKRATRKFKDIDGVTKALDTKFKANIFDKLFTEPRIKTPAQVEKVIGKEHKKFLEKFIESKSSGTTLVHESDKRPEVNNLDDFNKLLEEK